jgi:very-short-patch-repair endonuclease
MPQRRKLNPEALHRARRMRREMSVAERVFWGMARRHGLGFEFRRQHPYFGYTLDFYCAEASLCVEFDGEQHDPTKDANRDGFLRSKGVETLRVPNRAFFRLDKDDPWHDWVRVIVKTCEERAGRPAWPTLRPQPPED